MAAMGPRLTKPQGHDLVALRVLVEGTRAGRPVSLGWELVDRYDESLGMSAMMRTTGFSLSITGQLQAKQEAGPPGVHTPDEAMPGERYVAELAKRGVVIRSWEN
jgi:lysine 6-dehydrogenase